MGTDESIKKPEQMEKPNKDSDSKMDEAGLTLVRLHLGGEKSAAD